MTQEEKAKAYDEALERAKNLYNSEETSADIEIACEIIFPELKESEDKRIRKAIIGKHLENYDEAEKEKADFVGDGFIECHADFLDFKEGKTYWLEYIGDDNYNVRSDNLLGKTYYIPPCQLYTVFNKLTWLEKQGKQKTIWHSEDEEPKRDSLILLVMQSGNAIVAKIIEPNHTFNHGERWAYIDDLLEKQGEKPQGKS